MIFYIKLIFKKFFEEKVQNLKFRQQTIVYTFVNNSKITNELTQTSWYTTLFILARKLQWNIKIIAGVVVTVLFYCHFFICFFFLWITTFSLSFFSKTNPLHILFWDRLFMSFSSLYFSIHNVFFSPEKSFCRLYNT